MDDNSRVKVVRIRLTQEENDRLNTIVARKNQTISDYIRHAIFKVHDPQLLLTLARYCAILEEQTLILNALAKENVTQSAPARNLTPALVTLAEVNKKLHEDILTVIKGIPK